MDPLELDKLADDILLKIRGYTERFFGVERLAQSFGVEENAIRAALASVRKWGYKLRIDGDQVQFRSAPDSLTATEIHYGLKTRRLGGQIYAYRSVKSTNDVAAQLAREGEPEGTLVVADAQSRGKGRLGRQWHSVPGHGIYMSLILRPKIEPTRAPGLSIVAALALAETLETYEPGPVQIKWPNDVLIAGRKTAGVLAELTTDNGGVDFVIVGVGINVNHRAGDFPEEIRDWATSLRRATGRKQSRVELIQRFLVSLEKEYDRYLKSGLKPSQKKLRMLSSLIGKRVTLAEGRRRIEADVIDIDTDGRLVINSGGVETAIQSGEVTIVKDRTRSD